MDKFKELRCKYPIFIYDSYEIKETEKEFQISYNFVVPELCEFKPTWTFRKADKELSENDREIFERTIFNLGMVEVISYLKATCSPKLIVRAGYLNKEQIEWYKKLYINGLGEFFYVNGLINEMNINTFLEIKVEAEETVEQNYALEEELKGNLIPVGGGKDSAVTLEVMNRCKEFNACYIVNPRGASWGSAKIAGYDNSKIYTPERTIDMKLLELNKKGFLNGHTPFSAILAFSSYAAAVILGKKEILLSNEASANESNVAGTNINHQYSKSIEFENDFRSYVSLFICKNGPNYFSILRPMTEWQIVRTFIKKPRYFGVFKSCNVGSKQDIWCESCSKCLYVYIMLSAFLNENGMKKIFKTNMLDNGELRDVFNGLVYPDYDKPFECVGTKDEINLSLSMLLSKDEAMNKKIPVLLKEYKEKNTDLEKSIENAINQWNDNNNVPKYIENILRDYIE